MPIYEYRCESCGNVQEALQRMSDPPLTECEACGGALKKLLSSPAFQFKGSGWYVTDYAKKDSGGSAAGSNGDKEASSTSAESRSSDTKEGSSTSGSGDSKASPAEKSPKPPASGPSAGD